MGFADDVMAIISAPFPQYCVSLTQQASNLAVKECKETVPVKLRKN